MTDLFSEISVGECLVDILSLDFTAQIAITKGDLVKMSTHTAGVIGTVTPITTTGDEVVGMAKHSAAIGAKVSVCIIGVVKVYASGNITLGAKVKSVTVSGSMTAGYVITAAAGAAGICGRALQTFATTDAGIILLGHA